MKTNVILWLVCFVAFVPMSCQKNTEDDSDDDMEENEPEIMFDDKVLIGFWSGLSYQIGYPPIALDLNISKLEINGKTGEVSTPNSCASELIYLNKNGQSFNFKEDLLPGQSTNCIGGKSYLIIKSKDTLNYYWTGDDNASNTANALLVRK
jgi:hypothetical protein